MLKWHWVMKLIFKYISNKKGAIEWRRYLTSHWWKLTGEAHKLTLYWQLLTLQNIYKKKRNITRNMNNFSLFFVFFVVMHSLHTLSLSCMSQSIYSLENTGFNHQQLFTFSHVLIHLIDWELKEGRFLPSSQSAHSQCTSFCIWNSLNRLNLSLGFKLDFTDQSSCEDFSPSWHCLTSRQMQLPKASLPSVFV